jgi:hypothetical protein
MHLQGSCHCGAVRFSVEAPHPYPFMRCYCSICRKTAGAGGYAINLGADAGTLKVEGEEHLRTYRAKLHGGGPDDTSQGTGERRFCALCGSPLWVWDPTWPDLIHPHASAIDTPLPVPPEHVHLMLGSKAAWVEPQIGPRDRTFDEYPDESLADWHRRLGLES